MNWFKTGAASCAIAVALGAFGAHGLKSRGIEPYLLEIWSTAVQYHFIHALGMMLNGVAPGGPSHNAGYAFLVGTGLFSGSLYAITLTGKKWLGAITPFGGTLFVVGWVLLAMK
jgi:uncharacterized membrane protein YgdD (TMEM256/DUF423 family)